MTAKRVRLTEDQKNFIIVSYSEHLVPIDQIAKKYGTSRQCIWKVLKWAGVDTSKGRRIHHVCRVCGKDIYLFPSRSRKAIYHYCNEDCYHAYLETLGEDYNPSGWHQRLAQKLVSELWEGYNPKEGHIIHHKNKDCTDYRVDNLMVFANQSDHLKYHRSEIKPEPLWDGAKL